MNYKGVDCPVCGEAFQPNEDIVVCPECGMPHHRACYKKNGHCAMEELHEEGKDWENPNEPHASAKKLQLVCPNCGMVNAKDAKFCGNCRTPLSDEPPASFDFSQANQMETPPPQQGGAGGYGPFMGEMPGDTMGGFNTINQNDLIGDIPAKDFSFYVQQNYYYFLRVFKLTCQRAKVPVFNWAAFFFSFFYFFYRKMYKVGLIIMAIMMISNIPSLFITYHMLEQALVDPSLLTSFAFDLSAYPNLVFASNLLFYLRWCLNLFCGFTANRHYYAQVSSKIGSLRKITDDPGGSDYFNTLSLLGGTNVKAVILIILAIIVLTFGISWLFTFSFMA